MLELILQAYRLKEEERAGWVLRGIDRPESVADHSWGTALLCLFAGARESIDVQRAVAMAVVHDLAEAVVGDVPSRLDPAQMQVSAAEKARREEEAMATLRSLGAAAGVEALWREYEERTTREAIFVRDMNLVDMAAQALIYEAGRRYDVARAERAFPGHAHLDEFFASCRAKVTTDTGRALLADVEARYREVRGGKIGSGEGRR